MTDWRHDLDRDGFAWLRAEFISETVDRLIEQIQSLLRQPENKASILAGSGGPAYGARNLLKLWPGCVELLRGRQLGSALLDVLGERAGVVRGLYFDKPPGHSWALPWHRDYTIAVREHRPSATFRKPTVKAGVPHLEADESLLAQMLTVRVHLDDMADDNGPLRVVPGSHRTQSELTEAAVTLHCQRGDVLLMRPLLLHASGHSSATSARHRRIVHLECAPAGDLPDGLAWDCFQPLAISLAISSSSAAGAAMTL